MSERDCKQSWWSSVYLGRLLLWCSVPHWNVRQNRPVAVGNLPLHHPNYRRIIRRDRSRNGGGIMAYVRSDIIVITRRKFEPANVTSLTFDVNKNNGDYFLFFANYRSPGKCKSAIFRNSLATALKLGRSCYPTCVRITTTLRNSRFCLIISKWQTQSCPLPPYLKLSSLATLTIRLKVVLFMWASGTMIWYTTCVNRGFRNLRQNKLLNEVWQTLTIYHSSVILRMSRGKVLIYSRMLMMSGPTGKACTIKW